LAKYWVFIYASGLVSAQCITIIKTLSVHVESFTEFDLIKLKKTPTDCSVEVKVQHLTLLICDGIYAQILLSPAFHAV